MALKRILVLSGSGSRGAFQAGAVSRLVEEGLAFDAFLGVSVGSLNAIVIASLAGKAVAGEEVDQTAVLRLWLDPDLGVADHKERIFEPMPSALLGWIAQRAARRSMPGGRVMAWLGRLLFPQLIAAATTDLATARAWLSLPTVPPFPWSLGTSTPSPAA